MNKKTKPKTAFWYIEEIVGIFSTTSSCYLYYHRYLQVTIYLTIEYKYTKGYKNIQISYCLKLNNPLVEEKVGLSFEDRALIDITDSGVADVVPLAGGSLTRWRLRVAADLHSNTTPISSHYSSQVSFKSI